MALQTIHLCLDSNTGQRLKSHSNPAPAQSPLRFYVGEKRTLRLSIIDTTAPAPACIEIADLAVTLAIDTPNPQPATGFLTLTAGGHTTAPVAVDATAADIEAAINAAGLYARQVAVTGTAGNWIVAFADAGAQTAPTAAVSSPTTTTAAVSILTAGSDTMPASFRLRLRQAAAVLVEPDAWSAVTYTPEIAIADVDLTDAALTFDITPDPQAIGGLWTLTVADDFTTAGLRHVLTARDLQAALIAALPDGHTVTVADNGARGFSVQIVGEGMEAETAVADASRLAYPRAITADLELTGEALTELLDQDKTSAAVTLEIHANDANAEFSVAASLAATLHQCVADATPQPRDSLTILDPEAGEPIGLEIVIANNEPSAQLFTPAVLPISIPIIRHETAYTTFVLLAGNNNGIDLVQYGTGTPAALLLTADDGSVFELVATGTPATLSLVEQ